MISVIIPALNEEKVIGKAIESVRKQGKACEILVVDGGSKDKTIRIAGENARVLISRKKGRAFQMNLGARKANGDILLFLHADTFLPDGAFEEIENILKDKDVSAGGFTLCFDEPRAVANQRLFYSLLYKKPFNVIWGDHAMFVRKERFLEVGGFPAIEIMEDYAISKNLRKLGKLVVSKKKVTSSYRRLEGKFIRTNFLFLLILFMYHMRFDTVTIKKLYSEVR